jgi:hypothetical protein
MYERRDLAAVMLLRTPMEDERIRLEDRLESLAGVARSVADRPPVFAAPARAVVGYASQ